MFKLINIIILVILFASKSNSEVVKNIKIINNDRITKETILVFSDIKIGADYSQNDLNNVIKDLYKTNFFSNISIDLVEGTLIIDVVENKIVQEVEINQTYTVEEVRTETRTRLVGE